VQNEFLTQNAPRPGYSKKGSNFLGASQSAPYGLAYPTGDTAKHANATAN